MLPVIMMDQHACPKVDGKRACQAGVPVAALQLPPVARPRQPLVVWAALRQRPRLEATAGWGVARQPALPLLVKRQPRLVALEVTQAVMVLGTFSLDSAPHSLSPHVRPLFRASKLTTVRYAVDTAMVTTKLCAPASPTSWRALAPLASSAARRPPASQLGPRLPLREFLICQCRYMETKLKGRGQECTWYNSLLIGTSSLVGFYMSALSWRIER